VNQQSSGGSVSMAFERGFLGMSLEKYLETCDSYELAPLFRHLLGENQPILEAGSGSGRWVAWFRRYGWRALGVEWSVALNARARVGYGGEWFVSTDMRRLPFEDASFGAVVALGSIEHVAEGPRGALREFMRVLRPGGIAIITVPHGVTIKRVSSKLKEMREIWSPPSRPFRESALLRSIMGKAPARVVKLRDARRTTVTDWSPVFTRDQDGWHFYEYQFRPAQIRHLVREAGFAIEREWADFHEQGILANFGAVAGRWIAEQSRVDLTALGRFLMRLVPVNLTGQMVCFVARSPRGGRGVDSPIPQRG
jgi:SAM-dependent methyltransferase